MYTFYRHTLSLTHTHTQHTHACTHARIHARTHAHVHPVGDALQVPAFKVTPTKGCSSHWSTPATGPAPQQLSLGTAGKHPPDMAKALQASLPELFFHWHHLCSLQDVSIPDSQVIPRMSLRQHMTSAYGCHAGSQSMSLLHRGAQTRLGSGKRKV